MSDPALQFNCNQLLFSGTKASPGPLAMGPGCCCDPCSACKPQTSHSDISLTVSGFLEGNHAPGWPGYVIFNGAFILSRNISPGGWNALFNCCGGCKGAGCYWVYSWPSTQVQGYPYTVYINYSLCLTCNAANQSDRVFIILLWISPDPGGAVFQETTASWTSNNASMIQDPKTGLFDCSQLASLTWTGVTPASGGTPTIALANA